MKIEINPKYKLGDKVKFMEGSDFVHGEVSEINFYIAGQLEMEPQILYQVKVCRSYIAGYHTIAESKLSLENDIEEKYKFAILDLEKNIGNEIKERNGYKLYGHPYAVEVGARIGIKILKEKLNLE